MDLSVNAVLPRTIMTATTVCIGPARPHSSSAAMSSSSFSAAMIWGIFVATYSSIFICSPILIYLGVRNEARSESAPGTPGAAGNRKPPSKVAAE